MELTAANVLWVIGMGASAATTLFWGAIYLGKLANRVDHAHERIDHAHTRLDEHDERLGEMLARRRGDRHTWE